MTLYEILGLGAVAALAGAINAIAGGGTLLTFPTLIFFGTRPEAANATSTLALVVGTAGSMFGYREHMPAIKNWLTQFSLVSLLGGLIGAVLLTETSDAAFARLVPFLVLFATILFVTQDAFRKMGRTNAEESKKRATRSAMAFQFAVAIYGGYFGAGIGILMLASLGFLGFTHIHEMNALKTVLSSLINVVATLWFIHSGLVIWPQAFVMIVGAFIGYYTAAHYSQRIPQHRVRQLISAIGFGISGYMFYKTFVK